MLNLFAGILFISRKTVQENTINCAQNTCNLGYSEIIWNP